MQIDNWLCKFGKLKSGALTKNKGVLQFWAGNGVPPRWGGMSIHIFNPKNEVGAENSSKGLIGSGSGRRRRGNLAPAGCRRGAHGVTRPTALGARQVRSISLPTSEFGFKESWGGQRCRSATVLKASRSNARNSIGLIRSIDVLAGKAAASLPSPCGYESF